MADEFLLAYLRKAATRPGMFYGACSLAVIQHHLAGWQAHRRTVPDQDLFAAAFFDEFNNFVCRHYSTTKNYSFAECIAEFEEVANHLDAFMNLVELFAAHLDAGAFAIKTWEKNLRETIFSNLRDFADGSFVAALGTRSLIVFWEDWTDFDVKFANPALWTEDEVRAVVNLNTALGAFCDNFVDQSNNVAELRSNPLYRSVEAAAQALFDEMSVRGARPLG